jgi:hypothetical protein
LSDGGLKACAKGSQEACSVDDCNAGLPYVVKKGFFFIFNLGRLHSDYINLFKNVVLYILVRGSTICRRRLDNKRAMQIDADDVRSCLKNGKTKAQHFVLLVQQVCLHIMAILIVHHYHGPLGVMSGDFRRFQEANTLKIFLTEDKLHCTLSYF